MGMEMGMGTKGWVGIEMAAMAIMYVERTRVEDCRDALLNGLILEYE